MAETTNQRRRRKSRKATGEWARLVLDLRKHIGEEQGEPYSQSDFATFFNVAAVTVARWEIGMQDPPRPKREQLAILAEFYGRKDLALAFRSGIEAEYVSKTDAAMVALLMGLLRWRRLRGDADKDSQAIHGAARRVFEVASDIVAKADRPNTGSAERFLAAEMRRRLKEIYDEENGWPGVFIRTTGALMYTPKPRKQ